MDSDKNIYSWIIVILIIVPFVVNHYSYKRGYADGKENQIVKSAENIDESCKNYFADRESEFCKNAVSNSDDFYCEDYYINKVSDNRIDICDDLVSEAKSNCKSNSDNLFKATTDQENLTDWFGQQDLENKVEEQQKYIDAQKRYQSCIDLWTDIHGYIKPSDADYCRSLYLR
jgi:hypothetical protein